MPRPFKEALVVVVGRSPAVVTETLWALQFRRNPPVVPEEIHVVVTGDVEAEVRKRLWSDPDSGLNRFERDWKIALPEPKWHLVRNQTGAVVQDILSEADNVAVGDTLVRIVARLCSEPDTRVHASLAGGRKAMSFYIGYVLSLFGRAQDELSHVLVSPENFEECENFWYPMPETHFPKIDHRLVHNDANDVHDAALAEVKLAMIPFVRLAAYISESVRPELAALSFQRVVREVECALRPTRLIIDCRHPDSVIVSGEEVQLTPQSFAMLRLVAEARRAKRLGAGPGGAGPAHEGWVFADEFSQKDAVAVRNFRQYLESALPHLSGNLDRFDEGVAGWDILSDKFAGIRTRLNDELRRQLPLTTAERYVIHQKINKDPSTGTRRSRFGLNLQPDEIDILPEQEEE